AVRGSADRRVAWPGLAPRRALGDAGGDGVLLGGAGGACRARLALRPGGRRLRRRRGPARAEAARADAGVQRLELRGAQPLPVHPVRRLVPGRTGRDGGLQLRLVPAADRALPAAARASLAPRPRMEAGALRLDDVPRSRLPLLLRAQLRALAGQPVSRRRLRARTDLVGRRVDDLRAPGVPVIGRRGALTSRSIAAARPNRSHRMIVRRAGFRSGHDGDREWRYYSDAG